LSQHREQAVISIDGSHGEGGGQILRTALALSCVLGMPFEITAIRKSRKKPGLQPQHLTAVMAAAEISSARVEGAELSSTAIRFAPRAVEGKDYFFDVARKTGSAGSTSLILQTILLPLCLGRQQSTVTVRGGTHVPWSPTFHYLKRVFLPLVARLNAGIDAEIRKWGWYPGGGGEVVAKVQSRTSLRPLSLTDRGRLLFVTGASAVSNLPRSIAMRQRDRAIEILRRKGIEADIGIIEAPSPGKGTVVFLQADFENVTVGFDALGAIGKRAEEVADEACAALLGYGDSSGALDPHLADQVIPYLALADGVSEFTTSCITPHLLTNSWVVRQFLDVAVQVEGNEGGPGRVRVVPSQR
jgi:RNA 3'-terminal phosphate cyclase (ATP)